MGVAISSPTTNVDNSTITYNASNQIQVGSGSVTPALLDSTIKERILLSDTTSGGASATIVISGLTTTSYNVIEVIIMCSGCATNDTNISLAINGDTTTSNYQTTISSGTTTSQVTNQKGVYMGQLKKTGTHQIGRVFISNFASQRHLFNGNYGDVDFPSYAIFTGMHKSDTTQITSITLANEYGYNFNSGVRILVFGLK